MNELPSDILNSILIILEPRDIGNFCQCNRYLNRNGNNEYIWKVKSGESALSQETSWKSFYIDKFLYIRDVPVDIHTPNLVTKLTIKLYKNTTFDMLIHLVSNLIVSDLKNDYNLEIIRFENIENDYIIGGITPTSRYLKGNIKDITNIDILIGKQNS